MTRLPAAKRYAQALFQLAEEEGQTEVWLGQLQETSKIMERPEARIYLTIPRVQIEDKIDATRRLLAEMHRLVVNTTALLVSHQGLPLLPQIASEYAELLDASQGRIRASVTTAVPLSEGQHDRLRELLGQRLSREVSLETRQDPTILGGAVVQVGDQVIDGSVRTRLRNLRHQLAN